MNEMKVLYGHHKSILLDECLYEIAEYTELWPQKRAFLIVPEALKAHSERRYFELVGKKGIMMAEILSFKRFAYRVFSEAGGLAVDYIGNVANSMLIQGLIRSNADQFKSFASFSQAPGYAQQLASLFGDFYRYNIGVNELKGVCAATEEPFLQDKFHDLALLFELREKQLAKMQLAEAETDLDRLIELLDSKVQKLSFIQHASFWIYGFGEDRPFTAQEYQLIRALSEKAADLNLALCLDEWPFSEDDVLAAPLPFYHAARTAYKLAGDFKIDFEKIKSQRKPSFESMAHWLISGQKPEIALLAQDIRLIRAESKKEELAYVAGEIRRLLAEEAYRYRDIVVAVSDLEEYQFTLQAVFRDFAIESFIDVQLPLNSTCLLRYVSALLQMCRKGNRFENLMALLRSGLTGAATDSIDRFENFCLAQGLSLYGRYREDKFYLTELEYGEQVLAFKHNYLDGIFTFCQAFTSAQNASDRADSLLDFLLGPADILAVIEMLATSWQERKEYFAAVTLVQSWNFLLRLLDDFKLVFKQQRLSLENFVSIVMSGLAAATSRIIPSGLDRVTVTDLKGSSRLSAKILFLVGASADKFPGGNTNEGILLDKEREHLEELTQKSFPNLKRNYPGGKAHEIFTLLSLPADALYLSCPSLQKSPSIYQQRLFQLLKEELVLKSTDPVDVRWNSPMRARRLVQINRQNNTGQPENKNKEKISEHAALQAVLIDLKITIDNLITLDDEPLLTSATEQLYVPPLLVSNGLGRQRRTSVSRIQKYRECPYAYFTQYMLGLRERNLGVRDQRFHGSLLHKIMEKAFSELTDYLQYNKDRDKGELAQVVNQWIANLNEEYVERLYWEETAVNPILANDPLDYGGKGRIVRQLTLHSLKAAADQISLEAYLPLLQEWTFPSAEAKGLLLETPAQQLLVQGIIDRVDLHADQRRIRIIDYKSGNHEIDLDAIYHGFQLQLPVYLQAFLDNNPNYEPGEMGFFFFDRPRIYAKNTLKAPSAQELSQQFQKHKWLRESKRSSASLSIIAEYATCKVAEIVTQISQGEISAKPSASEKGTLPCTWCDYKSLCNFDERTLVQRQKILKALPLPAEYPELMAEEAPVSKKEARLRFLEQEMQNYIDKYKEDIKESTDELD